MTKQLFYFLLSFLKSPGFGDETLVLTVFALFERGQVAEQFI